MSSRAETGEAASRPSPRAEAKESTSSVGARLRERREQLGLSLRELARRLEVSPSLVSQIETGKIQPSVRTLYAIVSELGLSLDEVFVRGDSAPSTAPSTPERAPRAGAPVQRAAERQAIELESGVRWERLTAWNDEDIEFMEAIYEVGGASSPDGKLVLSGTLGVTVGFEEHVLRPGDSISFESTIPHRLHNDGDEVVRAIWVTLGRYH